MIEELLKLCKPGDKVRQRGVWTGARSPLTVDRTAIKCGTEQWFWDLDSDPPQPGLCITEHDLALTLNCVPIAPEVRRWRGVVGGKEL